MSYKYVKTAKELTLLLTTVPLVNHENLIASFLKLAYEAGKDEGYEDGKRSGFRLAERDFYGDDI